MEIQDLRILTLMNINEKRNNKKNERPTMYIQNRRDSSIFKGCSPLQYHNSLMFLKPAIAYFAYTKRCLQGDTLANQAHLVFCRPK